MTNEESDQQASESDEKGAAVRFPPPLIFLSFIILGWVCDRFWPIALGVADGLKPVGIAVLLLGIAVAILINGEFKRRGTAIEPWKPTTLIVTSGFYSWSRNPIYTAFCFGNIGAGLALDSFWILISFIPAALLLYYLAIAKEEAYLEKKFGEEYIAYKNKVRRWL